MEDPARIAMDISSALQAIKYSIERGMPSRLVRNGDLREASEAVGSIEKIRFEFNAFSRFNLRRDLTTETLSEICAKAARDLRILTEASDFRSLTQEIIFRFPMSSRERENLLFQVFPDLSSRHPVLPIAMALHDILFDLGRGMLPVTQKSPELPLQQPKTQMGSSGEASAESIDIQKLKRIVPQQKLAPIQFEVREEKLFVKNAGNHFLQEDKSNIKAAKEELLKNGKMLIDALAGKNYDKRLLEQIETIQTQIDLDKSVIQIGITNISLAAVSESLKNEMPDSVSALIYAHSVSVGMYIAQFPDWSQFAEKAAAVELSREDINVVRKNVEGIIDQLDREKDVVDQEVPRALRQLTISMQTLRVVPSRVIFASIRTIENLAIGIFRYAVSMFEQAAKETVKETVKIVAKKAAIALVTIAISSSSGLEPLAHKVKELAWVKNALEIVRKNIE